MGLGAGVGARGGEAYGRYIHENADKFNITHLCDVVEAIYDVFKDVERGVYNEYPHIRPILPDQITFVQAEDLLNEYPNLSPKERENEITRK